MKNTKSGQLIKSMQFSIDGRSVQDFHDNTKPFIDGGLLENDEMCSELVYYFIFKARRNVKCNGLYRVYQNVCRRGHADGNNTIKDVHLSYEDIVRKFFEQRGRCYYTNIPLSLVHKHARFVSVDRINSSKKVYSPSGTVLTFSSYNYYKKNFDETTPEGFIELCQSVIEENNKKQNRIDIPQIPDILIPVTEKS